MPALYLLRFDDICPRMNWDVWKQVERILIENRVQPLLAVVPDNRDPQLDVGAPEPAFWDKVREWQQRGWAIGLHGHQHRYVSESAGILGRNRYSEFAGLPETEQARKLSEALGIFRARGVRPDAWIAPAHSFDDATVRLLAGSEIGCISDGYSLLPYVCRRGLLWVPQQLGKFYRLPFGTWTVCLHVNSWTLSDIEAFERAVRAFRPSMVSLGQLRDRYGRRDMGWPDNLFFACFRAARSLRG